MLAGMAQPKRPTYKIACMPADGIGPEVINAGIEVLKTLAWVLGEFQLEFDLLEWGTDYFNKHGKYVPDDVLETLKQYDAILCGAVATSGQSVLENCNATQVRKLIHFLTDVPHSLWALHQAICQPLQQYANVRSFRVLRGTTSPLETCQPGDIDWVIIRENSEGEYAGHGARSHVGQPWEVVTEVAVFTRHGVERLVRFAFETARQRGRKQLTVVTKPTAHREGLALWDEVAAAVAKDFPDVAWDTTSVDTMPTRMVLHPSSLDTIVATNQHADILSDLGASLSGNTNLSARSALDPTRRNPSLFQPVPASAFAAANPIATFRAAAAMIRWLGHADAADALLACVETVCESGVKTADLGGEAGTKDVAVAVSAEIESELGFSLVTYPSLRRKIVLETCRRKLGF